MASFKYVVISFDEMEQVEYAPINWCVESLENEDQCDLIRKRKAFYWPPTSTTESSFNKARKKCSVAEVNWPVYQGRILAVAGKSIAVIAKRLSNLS